MVDIIEGVIDRAQRVGIYGSEGIGKSTLAAQFPDPLFIDIEDGTAQMNVRRVKKPKTWEDLIAVIKEIAATKDICRTLVIDTADKAETYCVDYVLNKYNQKSIEGFGYGKGYTILAEEYQKLLDACDLVIDSGKNIVIIAHAKMRKQELPDEAGAFDRWEMKMTKYVAPLVKEWCDMLLFLNYQTYVVEMENKSKKAQGGKRVIYTSHSPVWDAKNRHNLPEVMDLDYKNIAFIFEEKKSDKPSVAPVQQETPEKGAQKPQPAPEDQDAKRAALIEIRSRMEKAGITEDQVIAFARAQCGGKSFYKDVKFIGAYDEKFLRDWILKYWDQIVDGINKQK